jgi:hypothetical protein
MDVPAGRGFFSENHGPFCGAVPLYQVKAVEKRRHPKEEPSCALVSLPEFVLLSLLSSPQFVVSLR